MSMGCRITNSSMYDAEDVSLRHLIVLWAHDVGLLMLRRLTWRFGFGLIKQKLSETSSS